LPDIAGQQSASLESSAEGVGGLLLIREWKLGRGMKQYLPLTDGLGSVCGLIDATDGSLAAEYDYDPYGGPVIERGLAAEACPFRHRTKYYDSESWLYYYGYRYYDPSTTKWISKDPLGEEGGWNLTCFSGNDPVNKYDPTGLATLQESLADGMLTLQEANELDMTKLEISNVIRFLGDDRDSYFTSRTVSNYEVDPNITVDTLSGATKWYTPYLGQSHSVDEWKQIRADCLNRRTARTILLRHYNSKIPKIVKSLDAFQEACQLVIQVPMLLSGAKLPASMRAQTYSSPRLSYSPILAVRHAVANRDFVNGIAKGIDPAMLNPNARFGRAFYVAELGETAVAEVSSHGGTATQVLRFRMNLSGHRILDLTKPTIADAWGYTGPLSYQASQKIAQQAVERGFNAIKFPAVQGSGANYAIFNEFDSILQALMVSPATP